MLSTKFAGSNMLPPRVLEKMKSNFLDHVHGFSMSSISKEQFGGILKDM